MARTLSRFYQPREPHLQDIVSMAPPMEDMYRLQQMKEAKAAKGEAIKNDVLGILDDIKARSNVKVGKYSFGVDDAQRANSIADYYQGRVGETLQKHGYNMESPALQGELYGLAHDIRKNKSSGELSNIMLRYEQFGTMEKEAPADAWRYFPSVMAMEAQAALPKGPLTSMAAPGILGEYDVEAKVASYAHSLSPSDLTDFRDISNYLSLNKLGDVEIITSKTKKGVSDERIKGLLQGMVGADFIDIKGGKVDFNSRALETTAMGKALSYRAREEAYSINRNNIDIKDAQIRENPSDVSLQEERESLLEEKRNIVSDNPKASSLYSKILKRNVLNAAGVASQYQPVTTQVYNQPWYGGRGMSGDETPKVTLADIVWSENLKTEGVKTKDGWNLAPTKGGISANYGVLKDNATAAGLAYDKEMAKKDEGLNPNPDVLASTELVKNVNNSLGLFYGVNDVEAKDLEDYDDFYNTTSAYNYLIEKTVFSIYTYLWNNAQSTGEATGGGVTQIRSLIKGLLTPGGDKLLIKRDKEGKPSIESYVPVEPALKKWWEENKDVINELAEARIAFAEKRGEFEEKKLHRGMENYNAALEADMFPTLKSFTLPKGVISLSAEWQAKGIASNRPTIQRNLATVGGRLKVLKQVRDHLESADDFKDDDKSIDMESITDMTGLPVVGWGYGFKAKSVIKDINGNLTEEWLWLFPSEKAQEDAINGIMGDLQTQLAVHSLSPDDRSATNASNYATIINVLRHKDDMEVLGSWDTRVAPTDRVDKKGVLIDTEDSKLLVPVVKTLVDGKTKRMEYYTIRKYIKSKVSTGEGVGKEYYYTSTLSDANGVESKDPKHSFSYNSMYELLYNGLYRVEKLK